MFRVGTTSFYPAVTGGPIISCQFLSVSRYIRKIADIFQVTVDISGKSPI
ncbi:hypothetical protein [Bacillus cereus]|nr:hypothetical protein [Bacillus cereus]